jgi:DNA-binding response OmpR family regulator
MEHEIMAEPTDPQEKANTRLLIVDDEPNIRSALSRALTLVGYAVSEAATGEEALHILSKDKYDLMILDILMPGIDGVEVMQRAHRQWPELLVIILTGHGSLESAITAIRTEAIDYLLKPAATSDIVAAVNQALQRRDERRKRSELVDVMGRALDALRHTQLNPPPAGIPEASGDPLITIHTLQLDCLNRTVTFIDRTEQPIDLTKGETAILANLMNHADRVISCQQLIRAIWGYSTEPREAENVIRPYISRLRRKLEADYKKPKLIQTVRRQGYRFSANPK